MSGQKRVLIAGGAGFIGSHICVRWVAAGDDVICLDIIVQSLRGNELTNYGDGSQTRSFCYVDDTAAGIMAFMDTPDDVTGPVNVGKSEEITIIDLARKIAARTGALASLAHSEAPIGNPRQRCPDIALIRSFTGWSPSVGIDEGLDRVIAYFSEHLDITAGSPRSCTG